MTDYSNATLREPLVIKFDLTKQNPFETEKVPVAERAKAHLEIERLRNDAMPYASFLLKDRDGPRGLTPLERAYKKLEKDWGERFTPPDGAKDLGWKFSASSIRKLLEGRQVDFRRSYYSLARIVIAIRASAAMKQIGLQVSVADVLALYRREGDLCVPLSLQAIDLKLAPDSPIPSEREAGVDDDVNAVWNWPVVMYFLAQPNTFHLDKVPPEGLPEVNLPALPTALRNAIARFVQARNGLLSPDDSSNASGWYALAKEWAISLFLIIMGGLDFWVSFQPVDVSPDLQQFELVFAFNYVLCKKAIDASTDLEAAKREALDLYQRIRGVTSPYTIPGAATRDSLVGILAQTGNESQYHFIPKLPIEFSAAVITVAQLRLEAMRRAPIAFFQDLSFQTPLPPSLGYLRYAGWDLYFVLIVLAVLSMAVRRTSPLKSKLKKNSDEENASLLRLHSRLSDFRTDEVWGSLTAWQTCSNDLRTEYGPRNWIRQAIQDDIDMEGPNGSYGPRARSVIDECASVFGLTRAAHLLRAVSTRGDERKASLWEDVEMAMVSHIGPKGEHWLEEPRLVLTNAKNEEQVVSLVRGKDVTRRVLPYYYLLNGFRRAFS